MQAGDRLRTDDGWVTIAEVFDTGTYEPVYNLRVAEYHTYFVGADGWGFAAWAHNAYTAEVNQIIKELVRGQGGTPGSGFSYDASRTGERATWANRQYLVEHLRAMLGKYYPSLSSAQKEQIADCAATRILRLARRDPQTTAFVPQDVETYRPSTFTVPAELSGIAHRQYTLTNNRLGVQDLAPIVANLNDGGWEVTLATALGDTTQNKAKGVYILRDPVSGKIYKVGKADSTGLVGRLERYAKDWVARGIRVQAEVYKLPVSGRSLLAAERVLRDRVRQDNWDLTPSTGAADGSADQTSPQGTDGWTAEALN